MKLQFVYYFDVWGNDQDGYEVNDVRRYTLSVDSIPNTESKVLQTLIDNEQVHPDSTLNDFCIEIHESGAEITEIANGQPFGCIHFN